MGMHLQLSVMLSMYSSFTISNMLAEAHIAVMVVVVVVVVVAAAVYNSMHRRKALKQQNPACNTAIISIFHSN